MEQTATDVGSRLRQAREQRGLTLRDIANTTKISMSALNAIEHNDFARLPGGVFSRAYVRTFAAEVGLNADELLREYRERFETEIPAEPLLRRDVNSDDRSRTLRRLAAMLVTCAGILICVWLVSKPGELSQELPDEDSTVNAVEGDLPEHTAPADDSYGAEEIAVANAAVAETDEPSLRLEIRFTGPCWISAFADGERVIYRLMRPGERALVAAHNTITLRVGDAGTVTYAINGASGRPLGRNGEAVTVRITRNDYRSLQAEPAHTIPHDDGATRNRGQDLFPAT